MIGFSPLEKPKTSSARQAILLPADEVRERPAGVRRDEPNQDPCLGGSMGSMRWGRSRVNGGFLFTGMKFRKKFKGQFKRYNYDELWRLRTGEISRENSDQFHQIQPTDAISHMKNNDLIQKWVCFFLKT